MELFVYMSFGLNFLAAAYVFTGVVKYMKDLSKK